jgi:hypothetical protein
MLQPVQQNFLKTIEELFDSKYNIKHNALLDPIYENNPKYRKAVAEKRVVKNFVWSGKDQWTDIFKIHHMTWPQSCKTFLNVFKVYGNGKSYQGFYQINEIVFSEHANIYVAPFHPFHDKFQRIMDLTFDAGFHVVWERFFFDFMRETRNEPKEKNFVLDQILDFHEILPFFSIPAIGYSIALLVFLCEIFYHDFLHELPRGALTTKLKSFFVVKMVKTKKIHVKPYNMRI